MITIGMTFFVFLCIFAVIGALVALLILVMLLTFIISGIAGFIEDSKLEKEGKCQYEAEEEKQND